MAAMVSHSTLGISLSQQQQPTSSSSSTSQQLLSEKLQLFKLKQKQKQKTTPQVNYWDKDIQVLGHRGALYHAVENTLESFQKCIDWKCHGVELDVFLLKDGNLVVFHGSGTDKSPGLLQHYCVAPFHEGNRKQTQTQKQSILDMTLEEAQQLQFVQESADLPALGATTATTTSAAPKVQIPTLRQVLELFQNTPLQIKMELKGDGTVEPCIALVEELNMAHQVVFSSFKHDRVKLVKQLRPRFRTAAIFPAAVPANFLELLQNVQPDEVHLRYDTCSVDRVAAAHKAGYHVMAWFRGPKAMEHDLTHVYVDSRQDERHVYDMVLQTGVDAVCCNRPNWVLELLAHKRNPIYDDYDKDDEPMEGGAIGSN